VKDYRISYKEMNKVIRRLSELWFWFDELEKKGIPRKKLIDKIIDESGQDHKADEHTSFV